MPVFSGDVLLHDSSAAVNASSLLRLCHPNAPPLCSFLLKFSIYSLMCCGEMSIKISLSFWSLPWWTSPLACPLVEAFFHKYILAAGDYRRRLFPLFLRPESNSLSLQCSPPPSAGFYYRMRSSLKQFLVYLPWSTQPGGPFSPFH